MFLKEFLWQSVFILLKAKDPASIKMKFKNESDIPFIIIMISLNRPILTVIGRAASLYTDPFLLFSGMLTAYSLFGRLMKQQPIRLKNEYISRLMR